MQGYLCTQPFFPPHPPPSPHPHQSYPRNTMLPPHAIPRCGHVPSARRTSRGSSSAEAHPQRCSFGRSRGRAGCQGVAPCRQSVPPAAAAAWMHWDREALPGRGGAVPVLGLGGLGYGCPLFCGRPHCPRCAAGRWRRSRRRRVRPAGRIPACRVAGRLREAPRSAPPLHSKAGWPALLAGIPLGTAGRRARGVMMVGRQGVGCLISHARGMKGGCCGLHIIINKYHM